ncbi:MAG TPA: IMP dehydrogenase, partial [Magnetospirillaceae bacterium]|nr:IMP dehydrogenase [Magnetospirillaceae bacterium]
MTIVETLSYDDVLLLPGYSEILPRDADVRTRLAADIRLNVPILSAAMDTVTEDRLAIALALEGGAGVIHRNLPPAEQADQVAVVKRYLNWIIDSPVTIEADRTVRDVRSLMARRCVTGLPVLNDEGRVVGIITARDLRFCRDDGTLVRDAMTPDPVVVRADTTPAEAREKFDQYKIEKLPVVGADGRLTGLITVKDMEKREIHPRAAVDGGGRLVVGAAVSPQDFEARMPLLAAARCDFVVIDTAHGDSRNVAESVLAIKSRYSIPVVGGNVATREGARRMVEAGADAVKVGIG